MSIETVKALPMILARQCVEAATKGNAQGWRGMSSGRAQDDARRIERKICGLLGIKAVGRVSQGMVAVGVHTAWDGTRRLIIDNERGYFDHVIARSPTGEAVRPSRDAHPTAV